MMRRKRDGLASEAKFSKELPGAKQPALTVLQARLCGLVHPGTWTIVILIPFLAEITSLSGFLAAVTEKLVK
jgi:hypothetical protein